MIKNLRGAKRSNIKNIILGGIIHGVKSPEEWIWKLALGRTKSEMEVLNHGINYTFKDGLQKLLTAKITDAVLDQIVIFGFCFDSVLPL